MNPTLQELKNGAAGLPASERAELVQFLRHSLDETDENQVRAEWLALAEQRMAEVRACLPCLDAVNAARSRMQRAVIRPSNQRRCVPPFASRGRQNETTLTSRSRPRREAPAVFVHWRRGPGPV